MELDPSAQTPRVSITHGASPQYWGGPPRAFCACSAALSAANLLPGLFPCCCCCCAAFGGSSAAGGGIGAEGLEVADGVTSMVVLDAGVEAPAAAWLAFCRETQRRAQ